MSTSMGAKRSRTIRRRASERVHATLAVFEESNSFPVTPKTLAIHAGVGTYTLRCLLDDDEQLKAAITEGRIIPSSRGKRPIWASEEADRKNPDDGKALLVQTYLEDPDLDVMSIPDRQRREDVITFIRNEVEICYGSNAVRYLRDRILEQIGTHHQVVTDIIEKDTKVAELTGEVTGLKTDIRLMDRRWNDRFDLLFQRLPFHTDVAPETAPRRRRNGERPAGEASPAEQPAEPQAESPREEAAD